MPRKTATTRPRKARPLPPMPAPEPCIVGILTITPYGHQAECYPRVMSVGADGEAFMYGQSSLSGYCADPDAALRDMTRERTDPGCTPYLVPDGTPVVDKRPPLESDGAFRASFGAPMLRLTGTPRPRPSNDDLAIWASFGSAAGGYAGIAAGAIAGAINLDECNLTAYLDYWRGVGARVGYVRTVDGARVIEWVTP